MRTLEAEKFQGYMNTDSGTKGLLSHRLTTGSALELQAGSLM